MAIVKYDLLGKVFGRLTVIEKCGGGGGKWKCRCECGQVVDIPSTHLRRGATRSCGCFNREVAASRIKHGAARQGRSTTEYIVWRGIIQRCTDPKSRCWKHYGGRGIGVCSRWRHDFSAFLEDVGPRPSKLLSIDRIDVNGNYEPGNVRWATRRQQALNRRSLENSSSKYVGVSFSKTSQKWVAYIRVKRIEHLGAFSDEESAARARDAYVVKHGLGARLNFPKGGSNGNGKY